MDKQQTQALTACLMSLYPTHDSLIEAVEYIEAQAPIQPNEVFALLMQYHNSLLKALEEDAKDNQLRRASLVKDNQGRSGRVLGMDGRQIR